MNEFEAPTVSSDTRRTGDDSEPALSLVPALTILAHPDPLRIGQVARLTASVTQVARATPSFSTPERPGEVYPLASDFLARATSLSIAIADQGGATLLPGPAATQSARPLVLVNGEPLLQPLAFAWSEVLAGNVVISVGSRFAFCLHATARFPEPRGPDLGILGGSDATERVRTTIRKVASHDITVLIRGESGTGKELVAKALHETGRRAAKPFVTRSMGALGSTATSELFGHEKGAFTGAVTARAGAFAQADGGTIFLDEIGLAPLDVQGMLHRVVEYRELQPLGSRASRRVDVRVISATDADLEAEIAANRFQHPLFRKLSELQIRLPPLRQRRQDIGLLLHHFLRRSLAQFQAEHRLSDNNTSSPWLSARDVATLTLLDWPGNVRLLKNVAQHMAIYYHAEDRVDLKATLRDALGNPGVPSLPTAQLLPAPEGGGAAAGRPPGPGPKTRASELSREQVLTALQNNAGRVSEAAKSLGYTKGTLYELIRRHGIQTTATISEEIFRSDWLAHKGDIRTLAERYGASERSVQLRARHLGLRGTLPADEDD